MANRVSRNPNDDEARKIAADAAHKAELQRVNKVEAVDPDQRAKQNKFRSLMQAPEDEDNSSAASSIQPQPSPAEPAFYRDSKNNGIDPKLAVPSPSYSPSPDVNEAMDSFGLSPDDPYSDDGLPQSSGYYQNIDLPWEPINSPQFQEEQVTSPPPSNQPPQEKKAEPGQTKSKGKEPIDEVGFFKKAKKEPTAPPKKEEKLESLFGPPGKPIKQYNGTSTSKKGETHPSTPLQPKKGEEAIHPTSRFWNEEKTQPLTHTTHPEKKGIVGTTRMNESETRPEEKKAQAKPFEPVLERTEKEMPHEQAKEKGTEVKKGTPDFVSPSLTALPSQILPAADAAAAAATPYIRPEIQALYHQMIGTIMVMAKPSGVSRTEFLLNNPAFSTSKFYGASIEITRFSTAPGAFNIRLTGNTEAVNAFNQSIPGLMAAFHNGNFNFKINRIEAEHSMGKPMFHRKESEKGRDSSDKGDKR